MVKSTIVRFMTRKDRRRVITERSKVKKHNKDNGTQIYINEDLTTYRAGLFRRVRKLLHEMRLLFWCYMFSISGVK